MKNSPYFEQAVLMLRVIPHVTAESCFALKGGTAINLFVRDMPRLSVDIDLTYLPANEPRETALQRMGSALARIAAAVKKAIPGTKVQETRAREPDRIAKLVVATGRTRIKIEPNEVIRGAVFPAEERELTPRAEELFELAVTARTLSVADLYGGKLCAALDRQHPRDLFDVKVLLENEGITDEIRKAFIVYLASHDRPMNELIDPVRKDIRRLYESDFAGMAVNEIEYEDLIAVREMLIATLRQQLTDAEKAFLKSLKAGNPKWELLGLEGIEKLPAIRWKLLNIQKLSKDKHTEALEELRAKLKVQG
ncbi:MAG: nucleotidyl transferase AbiEii/AbiGii toxin family protein [Sulfuricaulis sp.]|uniref:nucleotidyl transferase AbiEii/AbiGii toxin family protein n=1 Tax=Sulfuricaulis sp. TaxID=2003553 RepID=UPI0034A13FD0